MLQAFLQGRSIQRKTISGGTTNGRIETEYETVSYKEDVVPEKTMKYARPFVRSIREEVKKVSNFKSSHLDNIVMIPLMLDFNCVVFFSIRDSKEESMCQKKRRPTFIKNSIFQDEYGQLDSLLKIIEAKYWKQLKKTQWPCCEARLVVAKLRKYHSLFWTTIGQEDCFAILWLPSRDVLQHRQMPHVYALNEDGIVVRLLDIRWEFIVILLFHTLPFWRKRFSYCDHFGSLKSTINIALIWKSGHVFYTCYFAFVKKKLDCIFLLRNQNLRLQLNE